MREDYKFLLYVYNMTLKNIVSSIMKTRDLIRNAGRMLLLELFRTYIFRHILYGKTIKSNSNSLSAFYIAKKIWPS